jgi:hypothetical protein
MSKPTVSAAGGAMPAEGHKTRRAALAIFGSAPALAVFPAVAAASDADANLFELIGQWREAGARADAADQRLWDLDDAVTVPFPDVLIRTEEDSQLFRPGIMNRNTATEIGERYRFPAIQEMGATIEILVGNFLIKHKPIVAMIERFQEIQAAHLEHEAAEHAAKEAVGYFELERQQEEARTEERRLCREVAVMQARTVPGLLAKLSAVADMYVHEDLEKDIEYMAGAGKNVSVDDAMFFVLRDCARMIGEQPC